MVKRIDALIRNYAVYLLLIITFCGSVTVYMLGMFSYVFLVIAAFVGSFTAFITLKRDKVVDRNILPQIPPPRILFQIINVLFVISFTGSVACLLLETFNKSIWYYVFIAFCIFLLGVELLHWNTKNSDVSFLVKTALLILNVLFSNQIAFPGGIFQLDGPMHILRFITPILETGAIQNDGLDPLYQSLPIHHILSVETTILCGSDVLMTYIYLGAVLIGFSGFCLYLIGKTYRSKIFAGIVLLLFLGLDYYVMYGTHPEHSAYNFGLSLIPIFVAYLYFKNGNVRYLVLFVVSDLAITFTHHFTAICVLFAVLCMWLATLYLREVHLLTRKDIYLLPVIVSLCLILLHWLYANALFMRFIGLTDTYISTILSIFESGGGSGLSGGVAYDAYPITQIFINTLGGCLLIIVSMVGLVSYFKKKDLFSSATILIACVLSVLLGFGIVLSVMGLMPDRLYPFLQVLTLVFFAAEGSLILFSSSKPSWGKIGLCLFISLLCFFSLTSTISGFETSPYADGMYYPKLYHPPQDSLAGDWEGEYIPKFVSVSSRPSFTENGNVADVSQNPANNLIYIDIFNKKVGYNIINASYYGQKRIVHLSESDFKILDMYDKYYENGRGYYVR